MLVACGGSGSNPVTPTLQSLAVTPASPTAVVSSTQQFKATGTYSNSTSQDLTTSVTWTSSNTGVATIVASGLATTVTEGSTTVTATLGSVAGHTTLIVAGATLVSIAVTPAAPTLACDISQQFTATGTFSDSSTQNLTSSVTWSSSDSAVALVNAAGVVATEAQGTATITATSGSVQGSTQVTVPSQCASTAELRRLGTF
jgi:uncharacterized protein YjdB